MTNELATISKAAQALAKAERPEEANEIRGRLKAIQKYLAKRAEQFEVAFEAAKFQCEAAAKAGRLWAEVTPGPGNPQLRKVPQLGVTDAGFSDTKDALICERIGELDPQDVAIYLEGMLDKHRYPTENGLHSLWKELNFVEDEDRPWLRVYNIWNFAKPDPRFGQFHPGMIPGQVLQNLNWYFTSPGDLVVDLFAGGGVTLDVCKEPNPDYGQRQCRAYDIDPKRSDIEQRDIVAQGIPDVSAASLVFLDPPYWAQMAGEYGNQATNLANLGLSDFYDRLAKVINDCLRGLANAGAVVALLMGGAEFLGQRDRGKDHAAMMFSLVGGHLLQRIIVPYTTQNYQAHDVSRAKKHKVMLNLYRDLLIWGPGK